MKKIKLLFAMTLSYFLFIPGVFAASSYYEHVWTSKYHELNQQLFGLNDVIKTDDGYVGIGGMEPLIYTFDKNGNIISTKLPTDELSTYYDFDENGNVILNNGPYDLMSLKKIININGKNYVMSSTDTCPSAAIPKAENIYCLSFFEISSSGEVLDEIYIPSSFEVWDDYDVTVFQNDEYVYLFTDYNSGSFGKLKKDFSILDDIAFTDVTDSDKELVGDLILASSNGYILGEYDGGYVSYVDNSQDGNYINTTFTYYKDGKEVWNFDYYYNYEFVSRPSMISNNGYILMSFYTQDKETIILCVDSTGKILEEVNVGE